MSLAINLTPSFSHSKAELGYSQPWTKISRIVSKLTKSIPFKAVVEVATLLTIFATAAIWVFAI